MICHYFSVPNKPSLFPALYLYTSLKLLFCSTKEKKACSQINFAMPWHRSACCHHRLLLLSDVSAKVLAPSSTLYVTLLLLTPFANIPEKTVFISVKLIDEATSKTSAAPSS